MARYLGPFEGQPIPIGSIIICPHCHQPLYKVVRPIYVDDMIDSRCFESYQDVPRPESGTPFGCPLCHCSLNAAIVPERGVKVMYLATPRPVRKGVS